MLVFEGDGASCHLTVQEKDAVLYLQLFCRFEISKLFKNHSEKFHIFILITSHFVL